MGSRAARLTASAAAWVALVSAGYFLFDTERQIGNRRQSLRAFDLHAREAASALANLRAAQQAYVAAGQGTEFWIPEVQNLHGEVVRSVDGLRASAVSNDARASLLEAASTINDFENVDRRARDYIRSGQTLMAGDVVFAEGSVAATTAGRQVESSRLSEHLAFDASEADLRRRQAAAAGAAGAFSALVLAALAFAAPARPKEKPSEVRGAKESAPSPPRPGEMRPRATVPPPAPPTPASTQPKRAVPLLKAAAELCTDFSRASDPGDLPRLLERAAGVMDASGLVVWLGNASGADLRPILAYGYPDHMLARMPTVPRSADNAAALAYRTGKLQVVLKRPGAANGAIVAPLLSSEGCVGALTAEILAGNETSESVQAMSVLVAAQLTGLLAGSTATVQDETHGRIASA
jgi:hypothetical protein